MKAHIQARKSGKGRPFTKGDPRIKPGKGPLCAEAISFSIRFHNALAEGGDPKELSKILWDHARRGRPWAIEILLDRLIGKVTQPIEGKLDIGITAASIIEARKLADKEIESK